LKKPEPLPAALFAVLVLASCASAPRTRPAEEELGGEFAALDPGALVYLVVDVPAARPILDLVSFDGGMLRSGLPPAILDKTGIAAAAVYPPGTGRRFLLAAEGRFPSGRAGFSFAFSPSWKRTSSPVGKKYWRSAREGLSVFLDSRSARVSDGDPFARAGRVIPPDSFGPLRRGAVLAGWIESAAAPINSFLEKLGIPLRIPAERALFGIYAVPPGEYPAEPGFDSSGSAPSGSGEPPRRYEAVLRIETSSPSQARGLIAMISLLRVFLDTGADIDPGSPAALVIALLSNPPVQEDSSLVLRSSGMDGENIALLFNLFSVYSN
jgi:hypothetical protein